MTTPSAVAVCAMIAVALRYAILGLTALPIVRDSHKAWIPLSLIGFGALGAVLAHVGGLPSDTSAILGLAAPLATVAHEAAQTGRRAQRTDGVPEPIPAETAKAVDSSDGK